VGSSPAAVNVPSGLVVTECRFDAPIPVNVIATPPNGEPKVTFGNLPFSDFFSAF